ncbi:glycosyltransferase family 2 protein [uncultured Mesonia sp.]|uniref:glycosyltransferase family 2 protein n=1 Tax=uncultured Mesonia sp. TaxID=399731 RepID=UPI00374E8334
MTHKVSIIIPFYNRFELLFKTLKSVKNQTYKNFEVILVDDCSEEQLNLEIVEEILGNIPLRYTRLSLNSGPGVARSAGRAMAQGDYIAYLDSDDWWDENFLKSCVKEIKKDKALAMVYGNTQAVVHGEIVNERVNNYLPNKILPTLFKYKKRFWATGACLWRAEYSRCEYWLPLRNNEDYIHDINVSKFNNNIKFVRNAILYNNRTAMQRTSRTKDDVYCALRILLDFDDLPSYQFISAYFFRRINDYKLRFNFKHLLKIVKILKKEFSFYNLKFFLSCFYLAILNFTDFKAYKLKRFFRV